MRIIKLVLRLVLLAAVLMQVYMRMYPAIREGCQWPANTVHRVLAFGDPQIPGNLERHKLRKRVDIMGNDMYLATVAKVTRMWLKPQVVAAMGDLLSSQWIDTAEFDKRADRFASIFPEGNGVVLNVSGNHDIGYHGEFSTERLTRFERRFGKLNFVHELENLRIVVVNSLSLDGPPNDEYQQDTIAFLNTLAGSKMPTILLTHVPLYKPEEICRDGPQFHYDDEGNLIQQNHLSLESSKLLLNTLFGAGAPGIILAGHDHEGCVAHYTRGTWEASSGFGLMHLNKDHSMGYSTFVTVPEVTVRSMMGEFGGSVALISTSKGEHGLEWNYSLCPFHVQHFWWVANVVTAIALAALPFELLF